MTEAEWMACMEPIPMLTVGATCLGAATDPLATIRLQLTLHKASWSSGFNCEGAENAGKKQSFYSEKHGQSIWQSSTWIGKAKKSV